MRCRGLRTNFGAKGKLGRVSFRCGRAASTLVAGATPDFCGALLEIEEAVLDTLDSR